MILNKKSAVAAILLSTLFFLCTHAFAESADELKNRMLERLPEINQLKESGVIGEKSDGFLGFVSGAADTAVVAAENDDRRKVYTAIARQQGVSPDIVGNRRALQISQKAEPGTWLQDSNGTWHQK